MRLFGTWCESVSQGLVSVCRITPPPAESVRFVGAAGCSRWLGLFEFGRQIDGSTRAAREIGNDRGMSSDVTVRAGVNDIDAFDFGTTVAAVAPALEKARVAIVTTAGLRADGVGTWSIGQGFVSIAASERRLTLAHASVNFDRVGLMADINVAYPADRLDELAARGVIGSVATNHLSFMGAQPDHNLATLRLDTGPEAAANCWPTAWTSCCSPPFDPFARAP